MTIFLIYFRIENLMISSRDGERYDDEMDRTSRELCKRGSARSGYGDIRTIEDMRDILLGYPVENLRIFPGIKLASHIVVQGSKADNPFTVGKVLFLVQNSSKYLPRTLTSAAYEDMFLLGLPVSVSCWIFFKKVGMEYLSYDRRFIFFEPRSRFFESEKHA